MTTASLRRRRYTAPAGVTLIELMITISILGVMASVTTMAIRRIAAVDHTSPVIIVADSLRVATTTGRTITIRAVIAGELAVATVHPDGSVVADSAFHFERLSGRQPVHAH